MLLLKKTVFAALASGIMLSATTVPAYADISILDKNEFTLSALDPLSLALGGSIRPEFIWQNGKAPDYYKNGHDGGTRFHAAADYAINSHTSLVGYYEIQADLFHIVDWDDHYQKGSKRTFQRQLYAGIKDKSYGTLTYGHQYGVYYDLVGGKSDMWDNDGHASANWIGYDGDYDGGERPKNAVKYVNTWNKWTIEADWLLPESDAVAGDAEDTGERMLLRRNHGGSLGVQYAFQDDLSLGVAYSQNRMTVKDHTQSRRYDQKFVGSALTWTPGNWYFVTTATYYRHFTPAYKN